MEFLLDTLKVMSIIILILLSFCIVDAIVSVFIDTQFRKRKKKEIMNNLEKEFMKILELSEEELKKKIEDSKDNDKE